MDALTKEYILLFKGISESISAMADITLKMKQLQAAGEEAYLKRCEEEDAHAC